MSRRLLLLAVLASAGCSREAGRVRDVRDDFYSALSRSDVAALRSLTAPEYLAVDGGRLMNLDSLIAGVTLIEQDNPLTQYTFADSAIRVDPPVAWLVYRARRIVSRAPFADTVFTVESATFRRAGGGWKLALVHRTPVTEPEPVAPDTSKTVPGGARPPTSPATRPAGAAPAPPR